MSISSNVRSPNELLSITDAKKCVIMKAAIKSIQDAIHVHA